MKEKLYYRNFYSDMTEKYLNFMGNVSLKCDTRMYIYNKLNVIFKLLDIKIDVLFTTRNT